MAVRLTIMLTILYMQGSGPQAFLCSKFFIQGQLHVIESERGQVQNHKQIFGEFYSKFSLSILQ